MQLSVLTGLLSVSRLIPTARVVSEYCLNFISFSLTLYLWFCRARCSFWSLLNALFSSISYLSTPPHPDPGHYFLIVPFALLQVPFGLLQVLPLQLYWGALRKPSSLFQHLHIESCLAGTLSDACLKIQTSPLLLPWFQLSATELGK